ncbi:MAG TPA: hypothetical protein VK338_03685 [Candidatus Nitrosocosmicus sp.]|nr:hypothetical protein [Candidatus Nitrosocosmicus sp.]
MKQKKIRVAIAGLGNCAGSLIEGLYYYRKNKTTEGLLFPLLAGYSLYDIKIVCAFDISKGKVGKDINKAVYEKPNNFNRIESVTIPSLGPVFKGPRLDGNPEHLQKFVTESKEKEVDVALILKKYKVDILLNLLPTGSDEATEYYGLSALKAGCGYINCIPTVYAQREEIAKHFKKQKLPLIGDDIKSQIGSTIQHRSVLQMLKNRGAKITKSSQINIGGNTDFANFMFRGQTKIASKHKSLRLYIEEETPSYIGNYYDPIKAPFKKMLIDVEATVFGGSKVKISIQTDSDDKPNAGGSIVDLIRIAKYEMDKGHGGVIKEACAYYMKSAPYPMEDDQAYHLICKKWA